MSSSLQYHTHEVNSPHYTPIISGEQLVHLVRQCRHNAHFHYYHQTYYSICAETMGELDILLAIQEGRLSLAKIDLERLLKRYPNKSYYWALNCYLLYAQGRIEESITQCRELARKTPSDTQALLVLHDLYYKLGLFKDANQLYDTAIKKYPTQDLIEAYFDKALEKYDVAGAQKAALQLQKNFKSTREHSYRAAITCYVMSTRGSEKEKALYLGLGAGFAEKLQPHENGQEVFVHAKIMHSQGKFDEVVKLVEPVKQKMLDLTLLFLDALKQTASWQKLYDVSYDLLFNQQFNDFATWKHLIDSAFQLKKSKEDVLGLIKLDTRNSHFASIHFALVYGMDITSALEEYFNRYKSKPSCASDLLNYDLPDLIVKTIISEYGALTAKETLSSKEATTLSNCTKILLHYKQITLADEKFSRFDNIELYDLQLVKMIESLRADCSVENIVQHIILLERYAALDGENYKVRMWLLNLYNAITATTLAIKTYKGLKIKMIQQDTLSYKLDLMPSNGNLNELVQIYRFFMTADAEVGPFLRQAFSKELYTKVEDFFRFGERLTNSLLRHLLILRILKYSRMLGNDYYNYFYRRMRDSKAFILSDDFVLHDNRDFKSEYNLGIEIAPLEIVQRETRKGTEYVKLNYLKELIIVERDGKECERLIKLYNKWISNPAYASQLSLFENHLSKLYLNIFKLAKLSDVKDKELLTKNLLKNLDMNKIRSNYLKNVPEISSERNDVLLGTLELIKIARALLRDKAILSAISKLHTELAGAQSEGAKLLSDIKQKINLDREFVEDQFDNICDALKISALKIA